MQKTTLKRFFYMLLFYCVGYLLCLGLFGYSNPAYGQTKNKTTQSRHITTENKKNMSKSNVTESPFACNMAALTSQQKMRILNLMNKFKTKIQEVKELPDGFAFRFPIESEMLMDLGEYITYERLCCPFFDFELTVGREEGPLWLKLKGRKGVKDFIKLEFGL